MPSELFRQLWTTIKAGKIFRGIIKNKAKDGSHYWVRVIIMPWMKDEKEIEKYVSIRHLIKDEKEARQLYAEQERSLHF